MKEVGFIETCPCYGVSNFYSTYEGSWCGVESAAMEILDQLCFFLVFCD